MLIYTLKEKVIIAIIIILRDFDVTKFSCLNFNESRMFLLELCWGQTYIAKARRKLI